MRKKFLFLAVSVLFYGCAKISPQSSQGVNFTVISPIAKLSDAGFIHKFKNQTELQIYGGGMAILNLLIKNDKICLNSACDDELVFNDKFFKTAHYRGILSQILNAETIYNGKNLEKTDCGFRQNISENFIEYGVCGKSINFKDTKNGIKINMKELN